MHALNKQVRIKVKFNWFFKFQLWRRFDQLLSKIDAKNDVKLNKQKPIVVIDVLSNDVSSDLAK